MHIIHVYMPHRQHKTAKDKSTKAKIRVNRHKTDKNQNKI